MQQQNDGCKSCVPSQAELFAWGRKRRFECLFCTSVQKAQEELDTGRSKKGLRAPRQLHWSKWLNVGLGHGLPPPRRRLRAGSSIQPREMSSKGASGLEDGAAAGRAVQHGWGTVLEVGMERCPSPQSSVSETSPHKNMSQQESFSNPKEEVRERIKMLRSHLKQRLLSHVGRQPLHGTGPGRELGTSQPSLEPAETVDKKFCQLNYCSLLLPLPHLQEEDVPGASLAGYRATCLQRSHVGCSKGPQWATARWWSCRIHLWKENALWPTMRKVPDLTQHMGHGR